MSWDLYKYRSACYRDAQSKHTIKPLENGSVDVEIRSESSEGVSSRSVLSMSGNSLEITSTSQAGLSRVHLISFLFSLSFSLFLYLSVYLSILCVYVYYVACFIRVCVFACVCALLCYCAVLLSWMIKVLEISILLL